MLDDQLSPHFNLAEFRCKKDYQDCPYCGGAIRARNFIIYGIATYPLEILRWGLSDYYLKEVEIIISSADRCEKRNAEVSHLDDPTTSWHWRGCAIDIFARIKETREPVEMLRLHTWVTQLWPDEDVEYFKDHIHITLARY